MNINGTQFLQWKGRFYVYILKQINFITHMGFFAVEAIWSYDGKFENMGKLTRGCMWLIILVALQLAYGCLFTVLWGRCDGITISKAPPYHEWRSLEYRGYELFAYDPDFLLRTTFAVTVKTREVSIVKEAAGAKIRGFILKDLIIMKKIQGSSKSILYEGSKYGRIRQQKAANGLLNKIALAPERGGQKNLFESLQEKGDCRLGTI